MKSWLGRSGCVSEEPTTEDDRSDTLVRDLGIAAALASRIDDTRVDPPWQQLLAALRRIPEALARLEEQSHRLERLEEQSADLLDRLLVVETALSSAHEARNAAALALAQVWQAATGRTDAPPHSDVVDIVRRLRRGPP